MFLAPEDTVFTISQKIQSHIDKNLEATHNNNADKFANAAFGVPGFARLVFWLAYHLSLIHICSCSSVTSRESTLLRAMRSAHSSTCLLYTSRCV